MKWILIGIALASHNGNHVSTELGRYDTLVQCFNARDTVLAKAEAYDGYPPVNTQFVCVRWSK